MVACVETRPKMDDIGLKTDTLNLRGSLARRGELAGGQLQYLWRLFLRDIVPSADHDGRGV